MSNADIEERLDRLERIFALQSTTHDKRAVRYIRVSTGTQSHEYQLKLTERFINNRKWQLQKTYEDIGVSGKTTNRPGLKSLLKDAKSGEFDVVIVSSFDRLFRSLKNMVVTIDELNSIGIDITSVTEPFDTTSSQGKLMFHIISAFAEFERDLTAEKIRDGIAVARQSGKILGRPKVYVNMTKAKQLRAQGLSNRKIARRLGISARTLDRAFKGESLSNEDILKLREQNLSLREISKRLGISVGTVHQAINEPNQI